VSQPRRDGQHPLEAARRRFAEAPVQLAEGFARLVDRSPPGGIERVMRTPVRRVVLDGVFWQMPQHLNRRQAVGMNTTIEWRITGRPSGGADIYQLAIADGRCRVRRRSLNPSPRLTITLDAAEFLKIATGASDPMQGFFKGRIKLAGDIMLAAKLPQLFRIPSAHKSAAAGPIGG
jgi:predicted lipid carrier protein YhbT